MGQFELCEQYSREVWRRSQVVDEGFSTVMNSSEHANVSTPGIFLTSRSIILLSLGHGITHQHEMTAPRAIPTLLPLYRVSICSSAVPSFMIRLHQNHPRTLLGGYHIKPPSSPPESNLTRECIQVQKNEEETWHQHQ